MVCADEFRFGGTLIRFVKNMVLAFVFSSDVIFGLFFGRGAFRFCVVGRSWTLFGSGGTGVSNVTDELGSHMFLRWSSSCLFVWKAWCFSFSVRGRVLLDLWVGTLGTSGFDWVFYEIQS